MKRIYKNFHPQRGYVLLTVMLLIGTLSLYLMYQFGNTQTKNKSWQLQKTTTEIAYWMDIERNYIIDNSINTPDTFNNISLPTLVSNAYLPYGQYRNVVIKGNTPQGTNLSQVSEFLCSPLPGVTTKDNIQSLPSGSASCPSGTANAHCSLDSPPYYACANSLSASGTEDLTKAQYYTNANYVAIGNYNPPTLAGVGLIVHTPGNAQATVTANSNSLGILPNGSLAQSLMSLLPNSYFNVFPTNTSSINDIGIASYLSSTSSGNSSGIVANNRYSKIVDMGLVQSTYGTPSASTCCGWSSTSDLKTGTYLYNGGGLQNGGNMLNPIALQNCNSSKNGPLLQNTSGPPTCIRINKNLFGPNGSKDGVGCARIDVLYTPYSTAQNPNAASSASAMWFMNDVSQRWVNQDNNYIYVSIGMYKYFSNNDTGSSRLNGQYVFSLGNNYQNDFFIYLVRCTRNPP